MRISLEDRCESIDASVFSGELLWIDEERAMLKAYIARWQRAIEQHERNEEEERWKCKQLSLGLE